MFDGIPVAAIAAVADNGVIGNDGDLPWHLPDDLRFFARTTRRHALVMGRRTWQSLDGPLPGRLHVVLSGRLAPVDHERVTVVRSLAAGLAAAADWERRALADGRVDAAEIMIVGGGGVYGAAWPWVDRFYKTVVHAEPEGDAWFPEVDLGPFERVAAREGEGAPAHVFERWERH